MRLKNPHGKKQRGYLLIDVMVGGALAAVVVAGVLTVLASARTKNVHTARDIVASQLVLDQLERCRSFGFANIGVAGKCPLIVTPTAVAGQTGNYLMTVAATAAANETINSIKLRFRDVTVTVQYNAERGSTPATRKAQATTRIYQ
jgi:hypothetical protein